MNVAFISLGCDKNTVDSEKIFKAFLEYTKANIVMDLNLADVAILNTCSFIWDAKKESEHYIKYLLKLKKHGRLKKILVLGCLATLYKKTGVYSDLFKDVDVVLPYENYKNDLNDLCDRMSDILSFSSFIKVCDGCNKFCSYCIIPYLKGRLTSSDPSLLIKEVKKMAKLGLKELNVVGQDITEYGMDLINSKSLDNSFLNNKKPIVNLVNKFSEIDGIEWIRLLYCYPEGVDDSIIELIKNNNKVLPYIDIPIQHASNKVLKLMNRNITKEAIRELVYKLRNSIKDICIRTTIIVGFPGETEEEFNELVDFVKEIKFDKLGVFAYSREELSKSYSFGGQIDEKEKNRRKKFLLDVQKDIVIENNNKKINKVYYSLVEGKIDKDTYLVRPYFNARDIDDKVFAKSKENLMSGDFVNVEIKKVRDYDLIGEVI